MTLHTLDDRERNGAWDSDFYAIVYDDDKDEIRSIEYGSTRYAGGPRTSPYPWADEPTKAKAERALARQLAPLLRMAEERRILEPYPLQEGSSVALTEPHRSLQRVTEPHQKCNGTGQWTNPRNPKDVRECFGCHGTGTWTSKERVKDAHGKQRYRTLPAGTTGTVLSVQAYGQFYRNGYNRPNRFNTTVKLCLDDGTVCTVPNHKLRLTELLRSQFGLLRQARRQAQRRCWASLTALPAGFVRL